MGKNRQIKIVTWIAEGVLIVVSVLLAFLVENKRQDWAAEKQLISNLKELRESISDDTLVLLNIRRYFVPTKDSLDRQTLDLIGNKQSVAYILQGLWSNDQLNYRNWTVKRMLEGDELNSMEKAFRNEIWEYNRRMNEILEGSLSTIRTNDKAIRDLVFTEIKYKNDFAKLHGLGDDQPLIRYREYADSSIVYSDRVKSLLVYNLTALQSLRIELYQHREYAIVAMDLIDYQIKQLE